MSGIEEEEKMPRPGRLVGLLVRKVEGCLGRSRDWGLKSPQGHSQVIPYSLDSLAAAQPIPGP